MIEANAFFAMFAVLILTVSVMHTFVLMRFVRVKMAAVPDEYFAEALPTLDRHRSTEQFVSRYRLAHAAVALLGVLLLGWLIDYMQRPDWDKRWVLFPVMGYFVLQWLPMLLTAMMGMKHAKVLRNYLVHAKRKAALKRRGLFDFVSPAAVGLAAAAYLVFVPFAWYATDDSAARALFIGALTFDYALTAFCVYRALYGKKSDPFETHAGRLYTIGLRLRSSLYSAITVTLFMSFTLVALRLGLDPWMPFALAAFLTAVTVITFGVFINRPSDRETGLDTREVTS
jgi:hypothetical protein